MFWNNAAETWVDVGDSTGQAASDSMVSSLMNLVAGIGAEPAHKETHWFSESGLIDVFVMVGPTPRDVSRQYARLTGVTPLPQRFALGYHQCRWNYNDQEDVHQVDLGFDQHDIPYDVLWLDIEHTDGKKSASSFFLSRLSSWTRLTTQRILWSVGLQVLYVGSGQVPRAAGHGAEPDGQGPQTGDDRRPAHEARRRLLLPPGVRKVRLLRQEQGRPSL